MATISDAEHAFSVRVPDVTATGQRVTVVKGERDGIRRVHAQTPDQCEVYFEVVSYPGRVDHGAAAREQTAFLSRSAKGGTTTTPSPTVARGLSATEFLFEGELQGMYKVRRFLYVDAGTRTYRVVYDPRSAVNEDILASLDVGRSGGA